MAEAHLPALTAAEKAAIHDALKRVRDAERLDPERHTEQRIFLIEQIIGRLEEPSPPLELDELILLFEAVLAASRRPPLALH